MPVIDHAKVSTFQDYAYAAHDQAEFLCKAMAEIRSMNESHFMTKKNKELIKEKKRLEQELELSKSMGPSESGLKLKQTFEQDQERLRDLQEQIYQLQVENEELSEGNSLLQTDYDTVKQQLLAASGTADFERDPNQGSLEISDLEDKGNRSKQKRNLLNELKVIKE